MTISDLQTTHKKITQILSRNVYKLKYIFAVQNVLAHNPMFKAKKLFC